MDLDRQAIERRDFPIGRRGYDPAAVDAHLRALASEFEELKRASEAGADERSLASTAASQVQSILKAAETAATDIERQAAEGAASTREQADQDAARTREEAIRQAQAHVAAVAKATEVMLERVGAMDGELGSLVDRLRAGAGRLAGDLAAVEKNMGELYDAAAGRSRGDTAPAQVGGAPAPAVATPAPAVATPTPAVATPAPSDTSPPQGDPMGAHAPSPPAPGATAAPSDTAPPQGDPIAGPPPAGAEHGAGAGNGDLDGARLIALNMALNGQSREEADRYLAEHFSLADRQKLIDEVYAAIER